MDAVVVPADDSHRLDAIVAFCVRTELEYGYMKCATTGAFFPTETAFESYLADDDTYVFSFEESGRVLGFAVVRANGRVKWFMAAEARFGDVATAMREAVHARCPACFGTVENPYIRKLFRSVPGFEVDGHEVTA